MNERPSSVCILGEGGLWSGSTGQLDESCQMRVGVSSRIRCAGDPGMNKNTNVLEVLHGGPLQFDVTSPEYVESVQVLLEGV